MSEKNKDLDVRPAPNPFFSNYDYTEGEPNETSPGGGLYHGYMGKYKSVEEFLKKRRKQQKRKKALKQLYEMIVK